MEVDEGLVFLKSVERGKCFIEYIPAENAWIPIDAPGYMYIDCLWVSGSFKGHGYSTDLLNACIKDSKEKGKAGLCILSAAKKKPFRAIRLKSREEAQSAPTPVTNYALFHDGEYVTNEQMNDTKFLKLVSGEQTVSRKV